MPPVMHDRNQGKTDLILVIGQEPGAVCEGFPPEDVISTIRNPPGLVYIVGEQDRN